MTKQEKRDDKKRLIKTQLSRKVRPHRPAAKVLEIAIALAEERIESMEDQKTELEWQLEYMRGMNPEEIEPEPKS